MPNNIYVCGNWFGDDAAARLRQLGYNFADRGDQGYGSVTIDSKHVELFNYKRGNVAVAGRLDLAVGCGNSWPHAHEYAEITCPSCGHNDQCWNCAVRCTDDSSGEGVFTCQSCGATTLYPIEEGS